MTLVYLGGSWVAGILFAQAIHPPWQLLPLLAFVSFVSLILWWGDQRIRMGSLCLLVGTLGAARLLLAVPRFDDRSLSTYNDVGWVTLEGVVVGDPDEQDRYTNLRLRAEWLELPDGTERDVEGLALVQTSRYPRRASGDRLRITGQLESPPIYEGFSYREYLAREGVYSIVRRAQTDLLEHGGARSLSAHLFAVRRRAQAVIARMLPEPQAALLTGILLGIEAGIPQYVEEQFAVTGTSHIIVISGFNITIVAGMFAGMAGRVLHRRWALLIAMAAVAMYTLFVGAAAAVLRAAVMGILYLFAQFAGRRSYAPVSLAAAALFLTLANPYALWDRGFLLSFAATAGLLSYVDPLEQLLQRILTRITSAERAQQAVNLVSEALLVTLAAQIGTMPLLLTSFGYFSPVTLLANALILPAQPYVILTGGVATLLGLILRPLGQIVAWGAWLPLTYTLEVVRLMAVLSRPSGSGRVESWMVWGYYALLGAITWWLRRPAEGRREAWGRMGRWLSSRLKTTLLFGLSSALLVLGLSAWQRLPDGRLHVHFLDVGQGDAIFIRTPSGRQALIDGGPSPSLLLSRLGRQMPFWDRSLDLVVLTHPDGDHITGLVEILERYDVDHVLFREMGCQSPSCQRWNELLAEAEREVYHGEAGLKITLDRDVEMEVLHPGLELLAERGFNDNSIVVRMTFGEASFLLTGDIEARSEERLIAEGVRLDSTVLKVAHHGAYGSSIAVFLEAVGPELAVISVGEENEFGHPCQDVLDRLGTAVGDSEGSPPIYRTDEHGTVHVVTDGVRLWVETERGR